MKLGKSHRLSPRKRRKDLGNFPKTANTDNSQYQSRLDQLLKLRYKDPLPTLARLALAFVPTIHLSYNWYPVLAKERQKIRQIGGPEPFQKTYEVEFDPYPKSQDPETGETLMQWRGPTLPDCVEPFLTIRVPLSDLNKFDITRVTEAIKEAIYFALENRPTRKESPGMIQLIPAHRRFLGHCQEEVFQQDIERYKLHMDHQLNFRQIAFFEDEAKKGKPIAIRDMPQKIKKDVTKESAVGESVSRIYEAIYLKPFPKARRRRLDAPAEGIPEYNCPEHGKDCPEKCQYLEEWMTKVNRTLPTDHTGS